MRGLSAYATAHFGVDFACAFLLYRFAKNAALSDAQLVLSFFLYNLLAFGAEIIIGRFFNEKSARICASTGIFGLLFSLAAGFVLTVLTIEPNESAPALDFSAKILPFAFLFIAAVAGLGNAFFHVGGGIDALTRNAGTYWQSGVFIAPGSLGIALGPLAALDDSPIFSFAFPVLLLLLCGACVWLFGDSDGAVDANESRRKSDSLETLETEISTSKRFKRLSAKDVSTLCVVLAATSVIFVRSFAGFIAPSIAVARFAEFDSNPLLFAFAAFFGKGVGGFLADRFGARLVGTSAILLAIPALTLRDSTFVFGVGIVLLNVSTAITLVSVARSFDRSRAGFAFGLTTLALLFGYFAFEVADEAFRSNASIRPGTAAFALGVCLAFAALALYFSTSRRAPISQPTLEAEPNRRE